LAGPYGALTAALVQQERLNVDETGHPENKQRLWTWVFRADDFTVFHIDPSRGSGVLVALLGKQFAGVLGCDYFSAYHKYMGKDNVLVQFCLAHLIRDLKFLTTLPQAVIVRWAKNMLSGMRRLFGVIHRRESLTPEKFQRALTRARDVLLTRGKRGPSWPEVQNLVKRFKEHGDAYFPLRDHAGNRADQQPGRAGTAVRGHRPAAHPGNPQCPGTALVRTHLDRRRHLPPARAILI